MQYTTFIPRPHYMIKKKEIQHISEKINTQDTNNIILDENNRKFNSSIRHSMISRIYPLSICSACRK